MSLVKQYSDFVDEAIAKALRHESGIDKEILDIRGFSTGVQRRLMNNLCQLPKENPVYCEAGAFFGGTACAAFNNNPNLISFIIEDYSQPFGEENVQQGLEKNIETFRPTTKKITLVNGNFFTMDLDFITPSVDVMFYDAVHEEWAQRKAWSKFCDKLSDVALIAVDDFLWESVRDGTRQGITDISNKFEVIREWILTDGIPDGPLWHNTVALFLLKRF